MNIPAQHRQATVAVNRRWLLRSAGVLALAPGSALARSKAGRVDELRGDAGAEYAGSKRSLASGSEVFVQDIVSTGERSRLTLKLGAKATISLGAETRFVIDRYILDAEGDFQLLDGVMKYDGKSRPGAGPSTFRTPYGLIGIRGTRFYAGPNRGRFAVLVGAGLVEVSAAGKTVTVGPQFGTEIVQPGAPPSAPVKWSYERIKEMLAAVQ